MAKGIPPQNGAGAQTNGSVTTVRISRHSNPSRQETEEESIELFYNFVHDRLEEQDIPVQNLGIPHYEGEGVAPLEGGHAPCGPVGYHHTEYARIGNNLKMLADDFARSAGRQKVQEEANRMSLDNITCDEFHHFLDILFENGENPRERIVTLFFFCSDIVARSALRYTQIAKNLIEWSVKFIIARVVNWIVSNGGWNTLFGNVIGNFQKIVYSVGAVVVFVSVIFAIWKSK